MEKEKVLEQLESIKDNSQSFISESNDEEDNQIWRDDLIALDIAIELVKKYY